MKYVQDFYNSIYKAIEDKNYVYEISDGNTHDTEIIIETTIEYPEFIKYYMH